MPVLYRKYRPKALVEIAGQEPITTTLLNALKSGQVSHAYLFAGPRGIGKTSVARILAKAVNCQKSPQGKLVFHEPCNECDSCLAVDSGIHMDLIEIDAASNRGIDDIRQLREEVHFRPSQGKFKIYILDEVHMLTPEAFNALLKTLEEPPSHALFILCTTEPYRVPLTIVSRCQRFDFQLAQYDVLKEYILDICKKEKIKVDEGATELLVREAQGAFRDALGFLEQVRSFVGAKEITIKQVEEVLGLVDESKAQKFVELLCEKKLRESLDFIGKLTDEGTNLHQLIKKAEEYLRILLLKKLIPEDKEKTTIPLPAAKDLIRLIRLLAHAEQEIRGAALPQLPLEIAVVEYIQGEVPDEDSETGRIEIIEAKTSVKQQVKENLEGSRKEAGEKKEVSQQDWQKVLEEVKPLNHSVEALLKGCRPVCIIGENLHLDFFYQFHKERIQEIKNQALVEKIASKVFGGPVKIVCKLRPQQETQKPEMRRKEELSEEEIVKIAEDIFNGEVIE